MDSQKETTLKKLPPRKTIILKSGRHSDGCLWFDHSVNLGNWINLYCSRKTKAYVHGFQSGIGAILRKPFYMALFISILDYRIGSSVDKHRDGGIDYKRMKPLLGFNINIILKKATAGGKFICPQALVNTSRIKIFNGDKYEHRVTPIEKGRRVALVFKFSLAKLIKTNKHIEPSPLPS